MSGWAFVGCDICGLWKCAGGCTGSVQFKIEDGGQTGSCNFVFHTGSTISEPHTRLFLGGNLDVSGTITAINYDVINHSITHLSSSGDSKFGDSPDDSHQFTGSIALTGTLFDGAIFRIDAKDGGGAGGTLLYVSASEAPSFMGPGRLGIGTDDPQATLEVAGHAIVGTSTGGGYIMNRAATNTRLHFGPDGANSIALVGNLWPGVLVDNSPPPAYRQVTLGTACTDVIYVSGSLTASCGIQVSGGISISGTLDLCPSGTLRVSNIVACSPLSISASQVDVTGNIRMSGSTQIEWVNPSGPWNRYITADWDGNSLWVHSDGDLNIECGGDRIRFSDAVGNTAGFMNTVTSNAWIFKDSNEKEIMVLDGAAGALTASSDVYVSGALSVVAGISTGTGSAGYMQISGTGTDIPMFGGFITGSLKGVLQLGSSSFIRTVGLPTGTFGPGSPGFDLTQMENENGILIFSSSLPTIFAANWTEFENDAGVFGDLVVGAQQRFSGSDDSPPIHIVVTASINMSNPPRTYAVFSGSTPLTATIGPGAPGVLINIKRHHNMAFDILISSSGLNQFDGANEIVLGAPSQAVTLLNLQETAGNPASNWHIF